MTTETTIKVGKIYKIFLENHYKYEGEIIALDYFFVRINDIKDGETIIPLKNINRVEEVQR